MSKNRFINRASLVVVFCLILSLISPSGAIALDVGDSPSYWIAPGDINGDNLADLVHHNKNRIISWKSDGDGTFSVTSNNAPWGGYSLSTGEWLESGDINGDGNADIVHKHSGGINTWLSDGDGTYTVASNPKPSLGYSMESGEWLTPGDVNNDGRADLVHRHTYGMNTWLSDGDGTYTVVGNGTPWGGYVFEGLSWLSLGDVNNDNRKDLVHVHGGGLNTWLSDGDGTYTVVSGMQYQIALPPMNNGEWLAPGNIDGDDNNKGDLVHRFSVGIYTWASDGDGTYTTVGNQGLPWAGYSFTAGQWFAPGSLNGDGLADLAHVHKGGVVTRLTTRNSSNPIKYSFAKPTSTYSMESGEWLVPGDVDGDGSADLVHRYRSGVNVWKSDGDGTYTITNNKAPWIGYSFE